MPLQVLGDEDEFSPSNASRREREVLLRSNILEAGSVPVERRRRNPLQVVLGLGLSAAAFAAGAATCCRRLVPSSRTTLAQQVRVLEDGPADIVTEALVAVESKRPLFTVFKEPFNWHKEDMQDAEIQKNLQLPSYNGKEGMWCVGLNLLGFSLDAAGGRFGDYAGPSLSEIEYFHHQGANCFRLAVTWERLQSELGSKELDPVPGIEQVVNFVTEDLGSHMIVDPHNGETGLQHNGVNVMKSDFVDFWSAAAKKWGTKDKVIFGLYNEPYGGFENGAERYFNRDAADQDGAMVEFWRQWVQAAIDAIRDSGATNLILVPGLRRSNAAQWSGAGIWGEQLAGENLVGNTRLAAVQDPANNLAFEVHQHMDAQFTGAQAGCGGFAGAEEGLQAIVQWALKYNKKLMMTEVSSLPRDSAEADACNSKLHDYLQQMNASGVFLGYQAWQSGCKSCPGNISPKESQALDAYRLHDFGRPCSADKDDCRTTRCCSNPLSKCYEKDTGWASCKPTCVPGIDKSEKKELRTNWTCALVKYTAPLCSDDTEDCTPTKCCNDPSKQCYQKELGWAVCRRSCVAGSLWEKDDPAHRIPWNCTLLTPTTNIQLK